MAATSGKTGTVDGACNEIVEWTVSISTDMLDVTDFCSEGWREFVEGLKGATGSIKSTERYTGTSTITLANSAGGVSISGSILWTTEDFDNEVSSIINYAQTFTFTGAVVVA